MTNGVKELIALAVSQVGIKEKYSNGHWVNNSKYNQWFGRIPGYGEDGYGYPWCAAFQSWLLDKTGLKALGPRTASCLATVAWFKARKRWSAYPALGAQILFGPGGGTHVGLVVGYDRSYVYTVEGNTNVSGGAEGDGVWRKTRVRRDTNVYGYGYPDYSGGSLSADPEASKFGYKYKEVATVADLTPKATAPAKTRVVTVKAGQTLSAIAVAAGITLATLLSLNTGIKDPDKVQAGDKVTLPAAVPSTPKVTTTPTPKVTPKPTVKPKPKPTKTTPKFTAFPGAKYFGPGKSNKYVTQLGTALIKHGYKDFYKVGAGPKWSESDRQAVQAFQRSQGWSGTSADGIPGKETWDRLITGKNIQPRVKAVRATRMSASTGRASLTYSNNLDGWIREALVVMKAHGIPGTYEGIHRNIIRESGGNPRICNTTDINAQRGTPSCGLLQTIAPTFKAYHVSGTSWDVFDPVANIAAACNYAAHNYGSIDNVNGPY
jgi:LysM repeat protein